MTLTCPRGLPPALLSQSRQALALDWLLLAPGVLGGRGGRDGAVLRRRAALPVRRGEVFVLPLGGLVRRTGFARGWDGGHVHPRLPRLGALSRPVHRRGVGFHAATPFRRATRAVCRERSRGRPIPFVLIVLRPPLACSDARTLGGHGGRRGGVCASPAESAFLQKPQQDRKQMNAMFNQCWGVYLSKESLRCPGMHESLTLTGICN